IPHCYPEATFEASNSNSTSLQPLVYVPRVGPASRPKLIITYRGLSSYRLNVEDFEVEQQVRSIKTLRAYSTLPGLGTDRVERFH
ncbi:hypothetical protein BDW62DRAFT_188589, partial [Aspergillus aurantiobrunneus]